VLLQRTSGKDLEDVAVRRRFFDSYERELARPPARHAVALLAALARRTPIAIGCFCPDEKYCHRSILREAIQRAARE